MKGWRNPAFVFVFLNKTVWKFKFFRVNNWQSSYYYIDDKITFELIDLILPVLELYQRVENDGMRDFLKAREETKINFKSQRGIPPHKNYRIHISFWKDEPFFIGFKDPDYKTQALSKTELIESVHI